MRIKKQNDIVAYFETIQKLEPKSILDAGMFLKRAGSISRQIMDGRVPEEVCLYGIDFFPEVCFAVWGRIYDKIYSWEDFFKEYKEEHWDLGIVLGMDAWRGRFDAVGLLQGMCDCCDYILLDGSAREEMKDLGITEVKNIKIERDVYYFIDSRN